MRIILITKNTIDGQKKKICFFVNKKDDLYYECGGFLMGSHISYHRDGTVWRTSPATGNRPQNIGNHLPLKEFKGWYRLGTTMITKEQMEKNPNIKPKDTKSTILEIDLDFKKNPVVNIVIELVEPGLMDALNRDFPAPENSEIYTFKFLEAVLILTIIKEDKELLLKPTNNGINVRHLNTRYSTNELGVIYTGEAYG
jgi:hypothetical protein